MMTDARPTPAPVKMISDASGPAAAESGFTAFAATLAGLIANKDNATPLVVGIHGPWGSGKTTLMKEIRRRVDGEGFTPAPELRRCHAVWYPAWKYADERAVLASLIEAIFKSMAALGFFTLAKSRVVAIARRFDQSKIFPAITKLVNGMDVSEFFSELPQKENLGQFDTFQKFIDDLLWTFLTWRFKLSGQEKPDNRKCALVLFIDDLDRCAPGHIVKVLETIKLFLNRSGCSFVLAGAHETLADALAARYGRIGAQKFLEKVVHTGFHLPGIPEAAFADLTSGLEDGLSGLTPDLPILGPALGHNPRQMKRFLNRMRLLLGLVDHTHTAIAVDAVLAWGIIEHAFDELAEDIRHQPLRLFELKEQIAQLSNRDGAEPVWQIPEDRLDALKVPQEFHRHLRRPGLADIVARCDMTPEQFDDLRRLSGTLRIGKGPQP